MKSSKRNVLRRSHKVFLNELNAVKVQKLKSFLYLCRDVQQYFIDMYWQRQDTSGSFAPLADVHRAVKRFKITTRLGQALAKQALEAVASQRKKTAKERTCPKLQAHSVALFYHFVTIEDFEGVDFDIALRFIGSGAPRLTAPIKSTAPIDKLLNSGWERSKTIRLGLRRSRLWVEFFFEKAKPALKTKGKVIGMDSNYKNGLVFSDGQQIGKCLYAKIRSFSKRQKHTHREIKDELGKELKKLDLSKVKVLAVEDLKKVKNGKRGTFSRVMNRRLSHWIYSYAIELLVRTCEIQGVSVVKKSPYKTSQFCRLCRKWDRRNRKGEKFTCMHCGHSDHADFNAAKNLEFLQLAGAYGLRSLTT